LFGVAEEVLAAVRPEEKKSCKMGYEMASSFLNSWKKSSKLNLSFVLLDGILQKFKTEEHF
jgi:hypothetical protein